MEKSRRILALVLCGIVVASVITVVTVQARDPTHHGTSDRDGDHDDKDHALAALAAKLNGFQQVPAIISNGTGTFTATLSADGTSINYTLTYSHLSSTAHAAHIHLGQAGVNGGVMVVLCGGGGKPECPTSGSVSGTITKDDVKALPDQGLAAGDFHSLLNAIRAGVTYVNVHTTNFPNGEIRGQVHFHGHDNDDDD